MEYYQRQQGETRNWGPPAKGAPGTSHSTSPGPRSKGDRRPTWKRKAPHPGCAQLPIECARALCLCVTLRKDKKKDKNGHRGHGIKKED